ncbi:MAG: chalcone isomerase family protein [Opitutaceae bacterium]
MNTTSSLFNRKSWQLLVLALVVSAIPLPATTQTTDWEPMGDYRYVYRMFFKLYDATLYATPGASADQVIDADTNFKLQFEYLRSIEKAIILQSAETILEKNLTNAELDSIKSKVARLNVAYTSVDKGDRSALRYESDIGTTLSINGQDILTIEGQEFARLYFKIWLGENPISSSMKSNLLGL